VRSTSVRSSTCRRGSGSGTSVNCRSLTNLAMLTSRPGQTTLTAILLGSTGWDGFSNSTTLISWLRTATCPAR